MGNYDASAVANLALERVEVGIEPIVMAETRTWSKFETFTPEKPGMGQFHDAKYIHVVTTDYPSSVRGIAEGGTVPAAGTGTDVKMTASLQKIVGTMGITWERATLGNNSKAYIKALVKAKTEDLIRSFKFRMNTQIIGYGDSAKTTNFKGVLAKVQGVTTTSITVYNHEGTQHESGAPGTRWLQVGMPIEVDSASDLGTASTANDGVIESITSNNVFVTTADISSGMADGDLIVVGDTTNNEYGQAITSLSEHTDDVAWPTTYQGITRASYSALQGNVFHNSSEGTVRELTEAILQEAFDAPMEYASGGDDPDLIIYTPATGRKYAALFSDYRRFTGKEAVSAVNHRTAGWLTKDLVCDPKMRPGTIFMIRKDSFGNLQAIKPFEFHRWENGKILTMCGTASDTDVYQARCRLYGQTFCYRPRANSVIRDIKES
jgi:hypothetical protein